MEKKILSDHKKIKKKLVTPINQMLNLNETNHSKDIVPEIIWIDMLYCRFGLRETVDIITKLTHEIEKLNLDLGLFNCCVLSCYERLNDYQKESIVSNNEIEKIANKISIALIGFKHYFPDFPINFLLKDSNKKDENFLTKFKKSINNLIDRRSVNSTYALATVLHSQNCAGHLFFSSKFEKFEINEILNYPDTEESKRVAAIVRSSIKPIIIQFLNVKNSLWNKNFWNICYQIEPCNLKNLTDFEP